MGLNSVSFQVLHVLNSKLNVTLIYPNILYFPLSNNPANYLTHILICSLVSKYKNNTKSVDGNVKILF